MTNTGMLTGPGNDYKHQIIITFLTYELMKKFVEVARYKNYVVLPEFSLSPNSSKIPDIAVWKTIKGLPSKAILIIEICNSNKVKDDSSKILELMGTISSIQEAFVIDKDNLEITKIGRTKTNKPTTPKKESKSDIFKVDLLKALITIS